MFRVLALESIRHQILVNEDLGMESILLLELLDVDIVMLRGINARRRHFLLFS